MHLVSVAVDVATQRQLAGPSGAHHAGKLPHPVQRLVEKLEPGRVRLERCSTFYHLHRNDVGSIEAGRHREQPRHAPIQKSRTDQKHHSQGDLRHNERASRGGAVGDPRACRVMKPVHLLTTNGTERRYEPDDQPDDHGEQNGE